LLALTSVLKRVADFTDVGKEMLRRSNLEAERRFGGNVTEVVDGSLPALLAEGEALAVLLDPRTVRCADLQRAVRLAAVAALEELYVVFAVQADVHAQAKLTPDPAAAAAAAAATSAADTAARSRPAAHGRDSLGSIGTYNGSTAWSESDDDGTDAPAAAALSAEAAAAELLERSQQQYRVEFQRVFKNWRKHVVLWKEIFPTAAREWSDPDQPGLIELLNIDMGKVGRFPLNSLESSSTNPPRLC